MDTSTIVFILSPQQRDSPLTSHALSRQLEEGRQLYITVHYCTTVLLLYYRCCALRSAWYGAAVANKTVPPIDAPCAILLLPSVVKWGSVRNSLVCTRQHDERHDGDVSEAPKCTSPTAVKALKCT